VIPDAAVKILARRQGVDPAVIDRDHALGVVLWALSPAIAEQGWVFKGGTCLRKAYFADYRFSEDLDFTVDGRISEKSIAEMMPDLAERAGPKGVHLLIDEMRVEFMDGDYGQESFEVRIPYRGALRMGSAQNIQLHLSSDEKVMLGSRNLQLIHSYDDAENLQCRVPCYSLEEILAEKLRAVGGQRRHAIARDVYDVAQLERRGVDVGAVRAILPEKAAAVALDLGGAVHVFAGRREEYHASWNRTVAYLAQDSLEFAEAFRVCMGILEECTR